MIKLISALIDAYQLNLVQLFDGGRHRHVVFAYIELEHFVLKQAIDALPNDERDEFDEHFRLHGTCGMYASSL